MDISNNIRSLVFSQVYGAHLMACFVLEMLTSVSGVFRQKMREVF